MLLTTQLTQADSSVHIMVCARVLAMILEYIKNTVIFHHVQLKTVEKSQNSIIFQNTVMIFQNIVIIKQNIVI